VTDEERLLEVSRLIIEAFRLSDTRELASVHHMLGLAAIEAAERVPARLRSGHNVVLFRRPRL
jgi:hypothetical protein